MIHTCPKCGNKEECKFSPEDCWNSSHGCRKCGHSFGEKNRIAQEIMRFKSR